jgi:glycosyltransferase involved in cell wall biosynthesis
LKEVIIIQRIFPDYQKPILDAVYLKSKFTLLHSSNKSGIKQVCSPYSKQISKWNYWKGDTHLYLHVFGYLRKNKPKIIVHELAVGILSLPLVLLARKILGYKFVLWGHTYNRKIGFNPKKNLSDKYRLWLQRRADAIITYSNSEKEELINCGIDRNKIFPALNTLATDKFLPIRNSFEKIGKENIKQALGFAHQFNLVFIGRLNEDKWPQYAIDVLNVLLNKKSLSIALHFVGSGRMEKSLLEYSNKNGLQNNVFFYGEIYDENKSGKLLFASDMMIMPGYVGLSVNHAFCFDCPVITFEMINNVPAHSPEIEYIIHGETGFIVKHKSIEDMAETIYNYLNDEQLKKEVKIHIRNMIENVCPMEKLISEYINAINYVSKNDKEWPIK